MELEGQLNKWGLAWESSTSESMVKEIINNSYMEQYAQSKKTEADQQKMTKGVDFLLEEIFTAAGSLRIKDQKKLFKKNGIPDPPIIIPPSLLKKIEWIYLFPPHRFIMAGNGWSEFLKKDETKEMAKFRNELVKGFDFRRSFNEKFADGLLYEKFDEYLVEQDDFGITNLIKNDFLPLVLEEYKKNTTP